MGGEVAGSSPAAASHLHLYQAPRPPRIPMSLAPPQILGLYSWQREAALTRLQFFRDQMMNRVFPAFANIEQEALEQGEAIFKEGLAGPASPLWR